MAHDPRFPPRHPPVDPIGNTEYPPMVHEQGYSREGQLRLEAEREKGRQIDARISSQQAKNEYMEDALAGRTSEIDKPAPGTRFTPRYWYGDDTVAKADREAGGRRTVRKIQQAEEAEKTGREERYEKGITSGLKGTEGEYERKAEIYSQLNPAEMDINYGGPRALIKPLYWENPKTGKREITEAHKDYDPRKLKPVYYTDNQGRPRVKLVKVVRQRRFPPSKDGKPVDPVTGRVMPPFPQKVPVPLPQKVPPPGRDGAVAVRRDDDPTDPSEPTWLDKIMRKGRDDRLPEQEKDESWRDTIHEAMPWQLGTRVGRSIGKWARGDRSSGEAAAAGDSPQARALQVTPSTPGEDRLRQVVDFGARVSPILPQQVMQFDDDGNPIIDEDVLYPGPPAFGDTVAKRGLGIETADVQQVRDINPLTGLPKAEVRTSDVQLGVDIDPLTGKQIGGGFQELAGGQPVDDSLKSGLEERIGKPPGYFSETDISSRETAKRKVELEAALKPGDRRANAIAAAEEFEREFPEEPVDETPGEQVARAMEEEEVIPGTDEGAAAEYDPAEDWTIGAMDEVRTRFGQPGIGEEDPAVFGDPGKTPVVPEGTGAIEDIDTATVPPPSGGVDPEQIAKRIVDEEAALAGDPAADVPFSSTSTTTFTGPPDAPAVFGDPGSTYQRPGPTQEQLGLRAATAQARKDKADRADQIRYARDPRNNPHFWYTRTGDPKADAAIASQMSKTMGDVWGEEVRGRTVREQTLAQQAQFEQALKFKSDAELMTMLQLPNLPYAMQQAILSKLAANKGLPQGGRGGQGGGGGGQRPPAIEGRRQLEAEDPVLLGQLDTMRDEYGTDIGRSGGSPGEAAEWFSGVFGGDVQTNNADQLSYTMSRLAGMMKAGSINRRNIAAVSSWLASEYDPAVLAWLSKGDMPHRISGSSITWNETVAFFKDVLAGRIPENPGRYADLGRSWWQG